MRRCDICYLKPEPAGDRQRARSTVSTCGEGPEKGGEEQEKEIRRRVGGVGGSRL